MMPLVVVVSFCFFAFGFHIFKVGISHGNSVPIQE